MLNSQGAFFFLWNLRLEDIDSLSVKGMSFPLFPFLFLSHTYLLCVRTEQSAWAIVNTPMNKADSGPGPSITYRVVGLTRQEAVTIQHERCTEGRWTSKWILLLIWIHARSRRGWGALGGLMDTQEPFLIWECVMFHKAAIRLGSVTNNWLNTYWLISTFSTCLPAWHLKEFSGYQ